MNQGNEDIRLLLVVGIAAMLLLFASILLIFIFTQRKKLQYQQSLHALKEGQQLQLIEAAVVSEETERHRIAEELHDEVGAILSSVRLYLKMINLPDNDTENKLLHNKSNQLLDESISKVRGISHSLHSHILQEFGLNEAITHFAGTLTIGSHLNISTNLDAKYQTQVPHQDVSIYRMIQELLNNILKHAVANRIRINSVYELRGLIITISHNGKGLTQEDFEGLRYTNAGMGLKNIQNRINLLKGEIAFSKVSDNYLIELYIPK